MFILLVAGNDPRDEGNSGPTAHRSKKKESRLDVKQMVAKIAGELEHDREHDRDRDTCGAEQKLFSPSSLAHNIRKSLEATPPPACKRTTKAAGQCDEAVEPESSDAALPNENCASASVSEADGLLAVEGSAFK
jgi:hypothetical protein